jgi:ribose 5-phosphate isomerase A
MNQQDPSQLAKQRVGIEAASVVRDGQIVGLGTGSTAAVVIVELGRRVREEGLSIVGIPTSFSAAMLATKHGIPIQTLDDVTGIDIAIDGADEVDPHRNLIKGGGGAHTREKVIASNAVTFVVVVDSSKLVEKLGEDSPVPVEVISMARSPVMRRLEALGGKPVLRMSTQKDGPVITDECNMILDVKFGGIDDPAKLDRQINAIPGVVENGLFVGMADLVLVGVPGEDEVRRMS